MEDNSNNYEDLIGIEDWTKEEKFQLLQGLKIHNYLDCELLSEIIPTKSPKDIEYAIKYYKHRIYNHPILRKKVKLIIKQNGCNLIPLADWATYLTNCVDFKELHTDTATCLRILADFEDFPVPICTSNIDFRKIYHTLANAIDGMELPKDKYVISILEKCLVDTALTSKAFIRLSTYKDIIKSINLHDKSINTFPQHTDKLELAYIRHLASQRRYNPFNIPEKFLTPS